MSAERADSVIPPAGDRVAEGGPDCRKETGDEGGAMKGWTRDGGWLELSGGGTVTCGGSEGTRTA